MQKQLDALSRSHDEKTRATVRIVHHWVAELALRDKARGWDWRAVVVSSRKV